MKILFAADIPYFPALGGANKINRRLLSGMASRGHVVQAIAPALGTPSRITHDQFLSALRARGIEVRSDGKVDAFTIDGVEVHAVVDPSRLRRHWMDQLDRSEADCVVVTSEDPTHKLLDGALKSCENRVVYLVLTASFLPFGPQAFFPGARRTKFLSRVRKIGAMSTYLARYIKEWGGLEAEVVRMPIFDRGPFAQLGTFDRGFITLVNPCEVKGLPIFVELARALPDLAFAAVPTWGTTECDLSLLKTLPNVRLLEPTENIAEVLAQTRVLLMPSLWAESFGMMCVEAMLHGIPVLASDVGGLPEAKQGTDFLLPVRPIEGFTSHLDGNLLPVGRCPEQDISPWCDALLRLSARAEYEKQSALARDAGMRYFESANDKNIETFLLRATGGA